MKRDSWQWNTQMEEISMTKKSKKRAWEETFCLELEVIFKKMEGSTIETREWMGTRMSLQLRYILFKIQIEHKWELMGNNFSSK